MLKLNVGVSRKVGEPNYGSRGASLNLEMEISSFAFQSLLSPTQRAESLESLRARIREAFAFATTEVNQELGPDKSSTPAPPAASPALQNPEEYRAEIGQLIFQMAGSNRDRAKELCEKLTGTPDLRQIKDVAAAHDAVSAAWVTWSGNNKP